MFILPTSACFAVIFFCCSFTAVNCFAVNTDNNHSLFSNDVYLICGRWYNTMKMPHENVPYIVRHLDSSEMSWYVKINKSFLSFNQLLKTCCIFGYFLEIFSWADTPFSMGWIDMDNSMVKKGFYFILCYFNAQCNKHCKWSINSYVFCKSRIFNNVFLLCSMLLKQGKSKIAICVITWKSFLSPLVPLLTDLLWLLTKLRFDYKLLSLVSVPSCLLPPNLCNLLHPGYRIKSISEL